MAWTTPKTWTNEPLVASDLNTHLRDNLEALKHRPSYSYTSTSDYVTTSTSAVSVDSSNMNETITLESVSTLLVGFTGTIVNTGTSQMNFALQKDGINIMEGTVTGGGASVYKSIALEILLEDLPIGSHIFSVIWWVSGHTSAISANKNHFYIQGL